MTKQIVVVADAYEALRSTIGHDHIITDPPYTEHVQSNMKSCTQGAHAKSVAAGFDPLASYAWVAGAIANTPRWSMFFCALEQLGDYRAACVASHVRSCIYCKARATPQLTSDRPGSRCEGIALFHGDSKKRWKGKGTHGFWVANPENRSETQHPTGKPTLLALRLVELFTDEGETVLDPFAGTGAIGRACAVLKRNYIGCDNNESYVSIANERIAQASSERESWLQKLEDYKIKYKATAASEES